MKSKLSGSRIKLIRMEDPYTNLKNGDEGQIIGEDDLGHIIVKWDNGSTLNIIKDVDEYVISESRLIRNFNLFENVSKIDLDYLRVKSEELVDLFEDRIRIFLYYIDNMLIFSFEINEEDVHKFNIDLNKNIIHYIISYGELGRPEDAHKEEKIKFDNIDDMFEIIEKKIHKLLRIYESLVEDDIKPKLKEYSLVFDKKYENDILDILKSNSISFRESDSIYYHIKKKVELIVKLDDEYKFNKLIPSWIRNYNLLKLR